MGMAEGDKKKLPQVPESLLKRRKRLREQKAKLVQKAVLEKKNNRVKRKEIFKRAEKYVKEYRSKEKYELGMARQARKLGNFFVPAEPKVAFVMRTRGINKIHP